MALGALESNHVKELRDQFKAAEKLANEKKRRLQDELPQTQAELRQLAKQVFACNVALAPVRALPHDILYEIFRRLPVYTPPPKIHIPTGHSHVCKSWRNVVSGMPHLWQLIRVSDRHSTSYSESLLERFGHLSRSLPLTVEIEDTLMPTHSSNDFYVLCWVLTLWRDRNRLRTLAISTRRQWSLIDVLLSLRDVPFSFQTLRHHSPAHGGPRFSGADASDVSALLERFPELKALWVSVPQCMMPRFPQDIETFRSWSKLTRLFLDRAFPVTSYVYFWNVIQVCPNLEVAYVTNDIMWDVMWDHNPRPSEALVHDHLRELGLHFGFRHANCNVYSILSCCRFPQLTSLHLKLSKMEELGIEDPAAAALVFPSLQSLIVSAEGWGFNKEMLYSILSPLSTVTDLTILCLDTPVRIASIACLTEPMSVVYTEAGPVSSSYLAPSLSNLCLQFSCHENTRARRGGGSRLDSYDLCVGRVMELRSRPSLRNLSIQCVEWPHHAIRGYVGDSCVSGVADIQRALEDVCTGFRKELEEIEDASDVEVDIRVVKSTGHFPRTPAVDHFLPYFS